MLDSLSETGTVVAPPANVEPSQMENQMPRHTQSPNRPPESSPRDEEGSRRKKRLALIAILGSVGIPFVVAGLFIFLEIGLWALF